MFHASELHSILALAAHPDDIEIGAAGTLLSIAESSPQARFTFVCQTGGARAQEAIDSARDLLGERVDIHVGEWRDTLLPYDDPVGLKQWTQEVTQGLAPELVLVPTLLDRHQDHRFLSELAWQLFRDATILEYEIPKWEGDRPDANLYVPLSEAIAERKLQHLDTHFQSQQDKPWYERDIFTAVLRLRGIESAGRDVRYAEAFVARKLRWDIS